MSNQQHRHPSSLQSPPEKKGETAHFLYQQFQLKLETANLGSDRTPHKAITAQFKPKNLHHLDNPNEYITGKIVNSEEPHNAEKLNYIAYDSENNIGLAQIWGMREALEDREAAGTVHQLAYQFNETDWKIVLTKTIRALEQKIQERNQGSCLLLTLVHKDTLITANLGDSTAYLVVVNENNATTVRLNKILHRPTTSEEYERLKKFAEEHEVDINEIIPTECEGILRIYNNKLGGKLAISGAIGDNEFDDFGLRHNPDIYYKKISLPKGAKAFVITACDGLTEPADMEKKIGKLVAEYKDNRVDEIAERLVLAALNEGSRDNISVIITPIDLADERVKYTGLFDGHGGDRVADELHKHIHAELNNQVEIRLGLK